MKDSLTQISIVLDRSGSMSSVREATISGFNEFVEGQKNGAGEANVSLVQFDSENPYEVLYQSKPVKEVPKLTLEQYVPRGGTPLHDAIGRTIDGLGTTLGKQKESERPGKVVIVILTDGLENASHEYTSARIAEMIKHQREVYKWEFIFLGANQDAILTGERLNIPAMNSVSYAHTAGGTRSVAASTSSNVMGYRISGQSSSLAYSQKQRDEAMEEDEEGKKKRKAV